MTLYNWTNYIRQIPNYPIEGVNFYDLNSLFAGPLFRKAIKDMSKKVTEYTDHPTHIVGVESRGFVLGAAIAHELNLPFVMVRKKGSKYPGELLEESYELEYGSATLTLQTGLLGHTDRCVIVDDLIATGGSMMATKRLIEQTGAKALSGVVAIDLAYVRGIGAPRLDIPVSSLERVYNNE